MENKKCSGCVRFEERWRENEKGTYHCLRQDYKIDKYPDDVACDEYWDKAEHEAEERKRNEEVETKRKKMWSIYANKPPVKLPIIFDGYGMIPECPICGEMHIVLNNVIGVVKGLFRMKKLKNIINQMNVSLNALYVEAK